MNEEIDAYSSKHKIDVFLLNLKIDRCIHFRDGYLVWEGEEEKEYWKRI
jgi:hypothetical protein